MTVENEYVKGLISVLEFVHQAYENFLFPLLPTMAHADSHWGHTTQLELLFETLKAPIAERVKGVFNKMAGHVDKKSGEALSSVIGIDSKNIGITHVLERFRDQNIQLVEKAGRDYAAQVREVFESPDAHTMRVEELRDALLERADVSKSRAELIARTETLSLNSEIIKTRAVQAGLPSYTWSTSLDERVRPMHAQLEGQVFQWDDPPVTNENGDTNNPGTDFQCRCIGLPLIDELEGI